MVLAQLGSGIAAALSRLTRTTVADDAALSDCLNDVSRALLRADVRFEAVRSAILAAKSAASSLPPGADRRRAVHRAVTAELCKILDAGKPAFSPAKGGKPAGVVMFVGLQGSGKTTTCAKYADYRRRKGFTPALVCTDTFRAGAFDQLNQNAAKAKIPFYGSYTESNPAKIAVHGVETFRQEKSHDLIIVDTSGRHMQEAALFEEMRQLSEAINPDLVIFVLDASIGQAAFDQAQAFKNSVPVGAVIVTKMDGHAKGGGALSAVAATKSPVIFIGTGEHIPDFEAFDAKPFVSRLLGMGDLRGLMDKFNEVVPDDDDELLPDLLAGDFTLRRMRTMFRSVQKMGPLGQVLSMIPGLSAQLIEKGKEKEGQAKVKRYMTIMASMTGEELDSTNASKLMSESRIVRVARGSGRPVREVVEMLEEHKRIAKALSKLPLKKLVNNTNSREPWKVIGNALPPGVMNQLGGMHGLQSMLKQMGAAQGR